VLAVWRARVQGRGHTRNQGRPSHLLAVDLARKNKVIHLPWVVSAGELARHGLLTGALPFFRRGQVVMGDLGDVTDIAIVSS
jgi:hypothetical protein